MLRVLPLGGLGEVGMNCMAIEQRGEVLLIDCGVMFDSRGLGIDVVHPDFTPLDGFGTHIAAVVITHGHEDHIGALPYLLNRYDVPIWAPPYAIGLIEERLREHAVLAHARIFPTRPREVFEAGSFRVEPIRVTHSIADATALAIETGAGTLVHSGDFKIDAAPTDGEHFDEARLAELRDRGVMLLMSDSTNIDVSGPVGSEISVGDTLQDLIASTQGAVVVAMFASNVHRLRMLGDIARRCSRKIVLLGRGVGTHTRVARRTGYLPWPDDLLWPDDLARELPRSKVLGIATGSQGEPRAALARLARGEHSTMDVGPGDRVIVSARTIPGNEPEVQATIDRLLRRGCDVRSQLTDPGVHVSGHAPRSEQRRMIELVRPTSFLPVHGTIHHLTRHAALAREVGVPNVLAIENGTVAEITNAGITISKKVRAGRVYVYAGRELGPETLTSRSQLAERGVAMCFVVVDHAGSVHAVDLVTRGVVDEVRFGREIDQAKDAVRRAILDLYADASDETMAEHARLAIERTFYKARGSKPVTMVRVHRLARQTGQERA
ncbi:MAG: ribonuclease J [Polyangiaceae bacterium]|nr:ribonuclease J [Polyangiaceae bacterium]